jgi:hypothetical protein
VTRPPANPGAAGGADVVVAGGADVVVDVGGNVDGEPFAGGVVVVVPAPPLEVVVVDRRVEAARR